MEVPGGREPSHMLRQDSEHSGTWPTSFTGEIERLALSVGHSNTPPASAHPAEDDEEYQASDTSPRAGSRLSGEAAWLAGIDEEASDAGAALVLDTVYKVAP